MDIIEDYDYLTTFDYQNNNGNTNDDDVINSVNCWLNDLGWL